MTLHVKRRGGDEYLYFLAGKRQFYLGRKDDPENINQENLLKAAAELDRTVDKQTKRYIESLLACTSLMDKKEGSSYLSKRKVKMSENLSKLRC